MHADGELQMGTLPLTLCVIATVFIALGGFWVNDYFDVKIDRINRPITRVVDLFVSRDTIFNLYIGATSIAVICAGVLSYIASCFDYFFIFVAVMLCFCLGLSRLPALFGHRQELFRFSSN
jgi:4-hydroxybenzoate polyprenyltransferase